MPFLSTLVFDLKPAEVRSAVADAAKFFARFGEITGFEAQGWQPVGCLTTGLVLRTALLPDLAALARVQQALAEHPTHWAEVESTLPSRLAGPIRQELFEVLQGSPDDAGAAVGQYAMVLRAQSHVGHEQDAIDVIAREEAVIERYNGRPGLVAAGYCGRWVEALGISYHESLETYEAGRRAWMADPDQAAIFAAAEGCVALGEVQLYQRVA